MALEYDDISQFETLAPVLEEYADWFGHIALCVAYHDEEKSFEQIVVPVSFQTWVEEAKNQGVLSLIVIEDIAKTHDDMVSIGTVLLHHLQADKKPDYQDFVEFKNLYSAFLSRIRRVEKDRAMDGSGLDEETGLRNAKTIESDLKKELERLARQGNPFSLVATRIDRYAGQPDQKKALSVSVANIKRCMRSFDDAYYLGNGHFLLSLKQADIIGAQAAVERLQQFLKEDEENVPVMTMSYCMVEPVPGDEVSVLLANMNQDLTDHMNESDVVLKFLEVSALERFVGTIENS